MAILNKILLVVLCVWPGLAQAAASDWVSDQYVQGKLISSTEAVGQRDVLDGLLHLRLNEGWHTYWRTSGDSGLPPRFDWSESENVENVEVQFPVPARFEEAGLQVFGYADEVMFPLHITPQVPGQAVVLKLKIDLLVCHQLCVPQMLRISLDIPAGKDTNSPSAAMIDFAARKVPGESHAGLKIESVVAGPDALVVTVFSGRGYDRADLFIESPDMNLTAGPEIILDETDQRRAMMKISAPDGVDDMAAYMSEKTLTFTLSDGQQGVEKTVSF